MKTKKSLGQNFFINKNLCEQISEIVLKENPETVIEIGPGTGSFTHFLSQGKQDLVLIEKDDDLAKNLALDFPRAEIKNVDFLEWDMSELEKFRKQKIVLFGSLPYNVSKPIIRKIISSEYFSNPSFFIIQKEVAEKYTGREPDNNLLSLETQIYTYTKRLFDISPSSFRPKPKVNSSFVVFTPKEETPSIQIEKFKAFLRMSFSQPRKTLKNNLKNYLKDRDFEQNKLKELLSKRPQHLSLEDFLFLYNNL